jgi:hypothetical protein
LTQAIGGTFQQRRPLEVALPEREPGMRGQAQGHKRGVSGGQAEIQRLIQ